MNPFEHAVRLMATPRYAAPIQVAVLVKQLLKAHGVAVIKAPATPTDPAELVWSQGDLSDTPAGQHNDAEQGTDEASAAALCRQVHDLSQAANSDHTIQQTRFLAPPITDTSCASSSNVFRTVYWQAPRREDVVCFLWHRQPRDLFTHHEKQLFHQLRPIASHLLTQPTEPASQQREPSMPVGIGVDQHESNWGSLSAMERKVLVLLKDGMTEADAARFLHRSPHTIHVHVKSLYRKFLVHSRADLMKAIEARQVCPRWV